MRKMASTKCAKNSSKCSGWFTGLKNTAKKRTRASTMKKMTLVGTTSKRAAKIASTTKITDADMVKIKTWTTMMKMKKMMRVALECSRCKSRLT